MPYHEPDPTDPSALVGVGRECTEAELREMAAVFADELAHLGHDTKAILGLFRNRAYAGPHLAWSVLGEEPVREIIDESVAFWSHCRVVVESPESSADRRDGGLLRINDRRR